MAYCSRCGVEVEDAAASCPLCEAPIQRFDEPEPHPPRYPVVQTGAGRQVRYLVWLVFTAVLLTMSLVSVTTEQIFDRKIAWSLYVLTGASVLWIFITLVVVLARRPIFVIIGQAVATSGFLMLIDLYDGRLDWFVPLGLPTIGLVSGASVLVWIVANLSRRSPALIATAVLFGCAGASVGLDLLISAKSGTPAMSWSFIVLAAATPPMVFLLYFHFRLAQRIDLTRILHT